VLSSEVDVIKSLVFYQALVFHKVFLCSTV